MGASSTTGVGLGSAEGYSQGTNRQTIKSSNVVGPHLVECGKLTLTGHTVPSNYSAGRAWLNHVIDSDNYFVSATISSDEDVFSQVGTIDIAEGGLAVVHVASNFESGSKAYIDFVSGYYNASYPPVVYWFLFIR